MSNLKRKVAVPEVEKNPKRLPVKQPEIPANPELETQKVLEPEMEAMEAEIMAEEALCSARATSGSCPRISSNWSNPESCHACRIVFKELQRKFVSR